MSITAKNVRKDEFIIKMAEISGKPKTECKESYDLMVDTIVALLMEKKSVNIRRVGTLKFVTVPSMSRGNPYTHERFYDLEHNTVRFKLSPYLREDIRYI